MKSILVAASGSEVFRLIQSSLNDYQLHYAPDWNSCLAEFQRHRHEFTFIDIALIHQAFPHAKYKEEDYQQIFQYFWKAFPAAPLIILSSAENLRNAVKALKAGAHDYLTYPLNTVEIQYIIESLSENLKVQSELQQLRQNFWRSEFIDIISTSNSAMQKVYDSLQSVAPTSATVLLSGETGTGKGVIARLIHQHSNRKDNAFVHVHCGSIPDTLLESELFGHEKGAFTSASQRKPGKFEIARGGTIFLDEVGTMSASAQIKLLQVLQDKIFQRIGGTVDITADVRVIAASNISLKLLSDAGHFRSDLYYRLNVFPITLPPLRERREDIPLLVKTLLKSLSQIHLKEIKGLHPEVMAAFESYSWPGNVRELENTLERAYILETSSMITPESIPSEILESELPQAKFGIDSSQTLAVAREQAIENFERQYLKEMLAEHHGKINQTAEAAGITTRQLHRLLARYHIQKEEYRSSS